MSRSCLLLALLVAILLSSAALAQPREKPAGLTLGPSAAFSLHSGKTPYRGHVAREIVRQGALLAAREELKLPTSDFWLYEPAQGAALDVVSSEGDQNLLELLAGAGAQQEKVAERTFAFEDKPLSYPKLLALSESMSREFFAAELAKHAAKPAPAAGGAESPAVDQWLPLADQLGIVPLFLAIRSAHALPDDAVNRPLKYESLIRAYAQLGLVSETYFSPQEAVCKARALLYAQRWVVAEPKSPRALQCRAFAWAMAGMPGHALADLAAAEPLQAAPGAPPRPAWLPVIDNFCRYEIAALLRTPSLGPQAELSRLLATLAAASSGDKRRASTILQNAGDEIGTLSRIFEQHYEIEQVRPNGQLFSRAAEIFGNRLMNDLGRATLLPESVRKVVERGLAERPEVGSAADFTLRAAVIAALREADAAERKAGTAREPAWSALARMIQEATFMHASRVGLNGYSVEDGAGDAFWKVTEGLSFQIYLSQYAGREAKAADYKRQIAEIDYDALSWRMGDVYRAMFNYDRDALNRCAERGRIHADQTTRDLLRQIPHYYGKRQVTPAAVVLAIDPFNPESRTVMVQYDWEKVRPKAGEWLGSAAEHPALAAALAEKLGKSNPDDIEPLLRSAALDSTEITPWRALAIFYEQRGKTAKWQATWDDYLTRDIPPRDRLDILLSLVRTFQVRRDWKNAETYALKCVETGFPRAFLAAGEVFEAKQEFDKAEEYYRRGAQGSADLACEWYFFCRRTGKGSLLLAQNLALGNILEYETRQPILYSQRSDLLDLIKPGVYYIACGEWQRALPYFQHEYDRLHNPIAGLYIALVRDHHGKKADRDQMLKNMAEDRAHSRDKSLVPFYDLAAWMRKDIAAGGKGEIEPKQLAEMSAGLELAQRAQFDYFAGYYLTLCGQKLGTHVMLAAMSNPYLRQHGRTLAGAALVEAGNKPEVYRDALQKGPQPPAEKK